MGKIKLVHGITGKTEYIDENDDFSFQQMLRMMNGDFCGVLYFRRTDWDKTEAIHKETLDNICMPYLRKCVKPIMEQYEQLDEYGVSTWEVPFTTTNEDIFNARWKLSHVVNGIPITEEEEKELAKIKEV
jgi:hypothetical protein